MDNFYGGLNGQSFSIKTIFTSYYALQGDISRGWASPVSVGEFVIVSYGMPNDPLYEGYRQVDVSNYNKTYNSTLWQKVYNDGANTGIGYKLITSMTGNTPKITIDKPVTAIDADQDPDISVDNTDVDNPRVVFKLPKSQVLQLGNTEILSSNQLPSINFDESDINKPVITFSLPKSQVIAAAFHEEIDAGLSPSVRLDIGATTEHPSDTGTIDNPILRFELPVAQTWSQGLVTELKANEKPSFTITSSPDNVNNKIISFSLPVSQIIGLGTVTELNADVTPTVSIDSSDINNPKINFGLPQAQVMANPATVVVDSTVQPSVTFHADSTVNAPKLEFTLPRAANIDVGDTVPATLTNGDFYLDNTSGYLYEGNANNEPVQKASLQVPKPAIDTTEAIDPYKNVNADAGTYELNDPTVTMTQTDTGWDLKFGLPHAQHATANYEMIGVEAEGSAETKVISADTVQFRFKLPRGANVYAGAAVSEYETTTPIDGALVGDLYINTDTGYVFKLNADDVWVQQSGSLQGPVGDTLRFVANYEVVETGVAPYINTPENTYAIIEDRYGTDIAVNDVISFTWIDASGDSVAYWCFKGNTNTWSRVLLTGGVAGLIETVYSTDESKTYSTVYINALLGVTGTAGEDLTRKTYTAEQINALLKTINDNLSTLDTSLKEQMETLDTDLREEMQTLSTDITQDLEDTKAAISEDITTKLSWGSFEDLIPTT